MDGASFVGGLQLEADGRPARPVVVVDSAEIGYLVRAQRDQSARQHRPAGPVVVLVSDGEPSSDAAAAADVVFAARASGSVAVAVGDPAVAAAALAVRIEAAPIASLALAWLLRATEAVGVSDALAAESAAYSMLLAGDEFCSWLAARPTRRSPDDRHRVLVARDGNRLDVVLDRPGRRNAVDAAMRDALCEGLAIARHDRGLMVEISGSGPSFCAGGDLDEFGLATDPAIAHVVRMSASVGGLIAELRERVTVRVHGACIGAGAELPAFAGRVIAAPDAYFALPEVAMGLIPGAGGTVSLPRRMGRHRTAWLALTGERIDAATARAWGLVDAVE